VEGKIGTSLKVQVASSKGLFHSLQLVTCNLLLDRYNRTNPSWVTKRCSFLEDDVGRCEMTEQALSDLKILEYGHLASAAYCAKLMADLGAEVIKVEHPGTGDDARRNGPFYQDAPHPERSGMFLYYNMNKMGITLNLEVSTGRRIFRDLIKQTDIFIHNMPPLRMEELGLDYETFREINPGLIMTSITPYGLTGPHRDYKANDLVAFHSGGLGYGTPTFVEDPETQPPLKAGGNQAYMAAAVAAAGATMGAVLARSLTGEGQHVDLSQQEALAYLVRPTIGAYFYGNPPRGRTIADRLALGGLFECEDGYCSISAGNDRFWNGLMEAMGNPEWSTEDICQTQESRAQHVDVLRILIQDWIKGWKKHELYDLLQKHHVPAFPVNRTNDVVNTPQLRDRGFFVQVDHPETGSILYPGAPHKFSDPHWQIKRPAPRLGEHNQEVYCGRLGFSNEELALLRETGVI